MKRAFLIALLVAAPVVARAGGFELIEQSPVGVATVGAQTGNADDPSAVYYNPAGLAFQRGLGVLGGVDVLHTDVTVRTPTGPAVSGTGTVATPTVYVSQRLGPHFAVGIGVFSNFVEHLEYPAGWAGGRSGTFLDLTTTTINPSVAIRPIPQIAIGFGFDIVPASLDLRHDIAPGSSHSATTATGLGGNVGLLVRVVPRYLQIGASYRSAVDLDLAGQGVTQVAGGALEQQDAKLGVPLPHNFGVGVASRPAAGLTLTADARVTLWSDLHTLTINYTDPSAGMGAIATKDTLVLNQRDAWGVRVGGEYRFLDEQVRVRLGVGYDNSPVRRGWLQPFTPDSNRVAVGAGVGCHHGIFGVDVGYSAQIVLDRTSSNPDPGSATYSAVRHVISLALSVRLEELGGRINVPEYKN